MASHVGIWVDHKQAVIVFASANQVTTRTLQSEVGSHPHFAGSQVGGGEKKYEERFSHDLDRFYDDILTAIHQAEEILILGPGEAKGQLRERLGRSSVLSKAVVTVETADSLTEPQIVARVKEHYGFKR